MSFLINRNYLVLILACLLCCTACAKSSPTPAPISAAAPAPTAEPSCEGFNELVKIAQSEDMLNLSPDEFIAKYKYLISVTSDVTSDTLRSLIFKAEKGDWLVQAEASYKHDDLDPKKMILLRGFFSITPSCAPNRKAMDARLSKLNPKRRNFVEAPKEEGYWVWDYVDPNNENVIKSTIFSTEETITTLNIERTTNNEGEGEGEGEG